MNLRQKKKFQKRLAITLGIVFAIILFAFMFASNGLTLYKLDKQKTMILQSIEDEKIRSNQLDQQVEQIGSKSYVEYIARKYLGLYYPDETIVIPVIEDNNSESGG